MHSLDRIADGKSRTRDELSYLVELNSYIETSPLSGVEKMKNFSKYITRQDLAYFLMRYELFRKVLNIHGSVVECGVFLGGGLMSFAQCSAILEPINHQRRILGFDTFEGFPSLSEEDGGQTDHRKMVGGLRSDAYADIQEAIRLFDKNRFISHLPKVELVKGDAIKTIPAYIESNPHIVISLLYLDFDLYEPTLVALRNFLPRMPKGAIVAFDELNSDDWPGETLAVLEEVGLRSLRIERFFFDSCRCYAVLE